MIKLLFLNLIGFVKLDVSELEALLRNKNLSVQSETQAFDGLLKWVNHDKEKRAQHMKLLLPEINLPLLPRHYLKEYVMKKDLLLSEGKWEKMFPC